MLPITSCAMHFLAQCKKTELLSQGFKSWLSSLKALCTAELGAPQFLHLSNGDCGHITCVVRGEEENFQVIPALYPVLSRPWNQTASIIISDYFKIICNFTYTHETRLLQGQEKVGHKMLAMRGIEWEDRSIWKTVS